MCVGKIVDFDARLIGPSILTEVIATRYRDPDLAIDSRIQPTTLIDEPQHFDGIASPSVEVPPAGLEL